MAESASSTRLPWFRAMNAAAPQSQSTTVSPLGGGLG